MDAPPLVGSPYQFVDYQGANQGQNGVAVGFDAIRYFWGTVAQQGVQDLVNIQAGGGVLA